MQLSNSEIEEIIRLARIETPLCSYFVEYLRDMIIKGRFKVLKESIDHFIAVKYTDYSAQLSKTYLINRCPGLILNEYLYNKIDFDSFISKEILTDKWKLEIVLALEHGGDINFIVNKALEKYGLENNKKITLKGVLAGKSIIFQDLDKNQATILINRLRDYFDSSDKDTLEYMENTPYIVNIKR